MSTVNVSGDTRTNVSIQNVTKKFGETTAVNNISLEISNGEFMTLLGPSGCGKTTLLSMILGILDVTSGSITFNDRRIDHIPMQKRDAGMVFQNYALFPHMTVGSNVEFGLKMRKIPGVERRRRTKEALAMVQMEHLIDRFPKELSGGQQQRVALARALVIEPKVLLLDEPLSNLDAKLRKDMRVQLKRLHQELGITTIYVTHDQEEALSLSTKVAVISNGVLQQVGTPQNIFLHPKNHFVANFIGYSNFFSGTLIEENEEEFLFKTDRDLTLKLKKDSQHHVGDEVEVTIKPENIQLVDEEAGLNRIEATVTVSDYVGNTTSYDLETSTGDSIRADVLGFNHFPIGSSLRLYFPPDKLILIDKE